MSVRVALAVLLLSRAANAADAPGTVQAPPGPGFVDSATGEAWSHVTAASRASFVLTGPARFQVGVRVNMAPDGTAGAAIVSVWSAGKPLAQFRLQPKAGTDTWKDDASLKPSLTVGFFVDVPEGPQPYEFRLNGGGAAGAAVRVIDAAQSKRPLPANAPVVKNPLAAPPAVASATPATPDAAASPTPAVVVAVATPTPGPTSATTPSPHQAGTALSAWIGGGKSWRSEPSVLGPRHHVQDVFAGFRWNASSRFFAAAAAEWRSGKQRVLLFEQATREVREDRYSVDLAAGTKLAISGIEVSLGPALRFSRQEDEVAPHEYAVAGGFAGVTVPVGMLDVHASGEAGAAVYDGTPQEFRMGTVQARTAWGLGVSAPLRVMPGLRIGAEYRGENVTRTYSERVSHGAFATVSLDF